MHRILVIDDDEYSRNMLEKRLLRSGYEVVVAMDGIEGLRLFEQKPPDLVITDIFMPEKEGMETIRDILKLRPETKIFAISGGPDTFKGDFLQAAEMFGARCSFTKPLNWEELLAAINEALPVGIASEGEPEL